MSAVPAVRRMVMFKHGVAYLERGGPANAPFELSFRKDEMNDVLKSLTVWVESGDAQVGAIGFDKPEDPELALAERKLNLAPAAALAGLIGSFRGRRVRVEAGGLRHEGEIVGLETERQANNGERKLLVLLTDTGRLALVDLSHATTMEFSDGASQADLAFLIERSRAATAGSNRSVRIDVSGTAQDLRVSYVVPAPAWRVSYRVACDDEGTMLMAWGIVHNPADEDLENLELTLTTGQPVSFMIDLYNPKLVHRARVEETARGATPPVSGDVEVGSFVASLGSEDDVEKAMLSSGSRVRSAARQMPATNYVDRGELFEYRVALPVSLRRGGSAMVPLLSTRLDARRQRVWRPGSNPHPDIVLAFPNGTGAVLEEGATVVYDQSVYAGEAMMPYSARGADVRLVFARDLAVRCRHSSTERTVATAIRLARDAAMEEQRFEEHHTFSVESDNAQAIEVVFELRKNPERSIAPESVQPDMDTLEHYRFKVPVPPRGRAEIRIVERWIGERKFLYTAYSAADLQRWLDGRFLDEATSGGLAGVLAVRERIRELQQKLDRASKERDAVLTKQKSLSEQLAILKEGGREGELRLRYVGELEGEQNRGNALTDEIARLRDEIEAANKEGNEQLRALIGTAPKGRYDALVATGELSAEELALANRMAARRARDVESVLIEEFQVKVPAIGAALAQFFGVPYESFKPDRVPHAGLLKGLRREFSAAAGWVPIDETGEGLVVLTTDPERLKNSGGVDKLYPGRNAIYRVCTSKEFAATLDQMFGPERP